MKRYTFQPGNGTNYDFAHGKDEKGDHVLIWFTSGLSGGRAMAWRDGANLHASYVFEKLKMKDELGDVYAVCAFINILGQDAAVGGGFDKMGQYTRPNVVELGGA
jgi:hypothetical protein